MLKNVYFRSCVLFLLTAFLSIASVPTVYAAGNVGKLTNDQAKQILQKVAPGLKVLSVDKAAVKGLWEVVVQSGSGKKSIVYLDYAGKNLVLGSIVDLESRKNLTKEKFDKINRVDFSQIPLDDALLLGDANAKHKVIVFDDPD
ncbi:hypothetical protein BMS3Bbin06_01421 [bacterium BMS3Bbin06]|nr:hypothetical protein BMS3Abin08_01636 [bacterium BMS3Abin08]GBE34887.1 hypothetical protein BMS3Bbin06_01421 [bacterium BMS3Bbin06]